MKRRSFIQAIAAFAVAPIATFDDEARVDADDWCPNPDPTADMQAMADKLPDESCFVRPYQTFHFDAVAGEDLVEGQQVKAAVHGNVVGTINTAKALGLARHSAKKGQSVSVHVDGTYVSVKDPEPMSEMLASVNSWPSDQPVIFAGIIECVALHDAKAGELVTVQLG